MNKLMLVVVETALEIGTGSVKLADAVRAAFAGVPANKRTELRKELFAAIVAKAGIDPATKKPYTSRELVKANPAVSAAYSACRMAYSRQFPSKKTAAKRKTAKAIVVPMTPKGVAAMARVAIAAIQKMEAPRFDAPRAVAAWQALADVFAAKE
jgi:hypothetical protein